MDGRSIEEQQQGTVIIITSRRKVIYRYAFGFADSVFYISHNLFSFISSSMS
jgi:hypothetical protein